MSFTVSGWWAKHKPNPEGYEKLKDSDSGRRFSNLRRTIRPEHAYSRRSSYGHNFERHTSSITDPQSWHDVYDRVNDEFEQHWVFLPSSPFLYYWDLIVFVVSVATGIFEPLRWAFNTHGIADLIMEVFLTLAFGADTVISFFRASRESTQDGVILITFVPDIADRYLRGAFLIDLITAFPFCIFNIKLGLLRMLRLWRLGHLLAHFQKLTGFSFSVLNLLEFVLVSFLVLHWISCLWLSIGLVNTESWLTTAEEKLTFFEISKSCNVYLLSLYWSVTVLTSVGFGDITPMSREEFLCAVGCMAVGGGVWAYILGNVCGMVQAMDKHRISFESTMNDVNVICSERRLPVDLQNRVREFYHHAREFLRMKQYHDTIEELSPALKGEVVRWMYGRCFKRVWYFDCMEDRCVSVLVEGMSPKMFAPQEFIEAFVGNQRAIVFLRSGLCVRKCHLLAPGSVWGTDVLLSNDEHSDFDQLLDTSVARSLSFAFVLLLGKDSLDHVASLYPDVAKRFRKAHSRLLCCRGVVAVARAMKRLERMQLGIATASVPLPAKNSVSKWDRLAESIATTIHTQKEKIIQFEEGIPNDANPSDTKSRASSSKPQPTQACEATPGPDVPLTVDPTGSASLVDDGELPPERSQWRAKVDQQIEKRMERDAVRNFKTLSNEALESEPPVTATGDAIAMPCDVAQLQKEMSRMRGEIAQLKEIASEQTRMLVRLSDRLGVHDQNF